jgi:hypothetical protein
VKDGTLIIMQSQWIGKLERGGTNGTQRLGLFD